MGRPILVSIVALAGCVGTPLDPSPAPVTPAADAAPPEIPPPTPPVIDADEISGSYRMRVRPREGRVELIARDGRTAFDYSGGTLTWKTCGASCNLAPGEAALWTDQTKVTYRDLGGTCYSNGGKIDCPEAAPCSEPGVFCAPLQMLVGGAAGGVRVALPDPIVQVAQLDNQGNKVVGCRDSDASAMGLCRGNGKVDAPSSNLVSPIPGDASATPPTFACSWCYGNAARAAAEGLPGLEHAVLSGEEPQLVDVATGLVAMKLDTDADFGVDIVVHVGKPTLALPGAQLELRENGQEVTCARPGKTTVIVRGGGFGPPAECLDASFESCPLQGGAAPGHELRWPAAAPGGAIADGVAWSDAQLAAVWPGGPSGPLRVVTPRGEVTTTKPLHQCPKFKVPALLVAGAARVSAGDRDATLVIGTMTIGGQATGVTPSGGTIRATIGAHTAP